MLAKILVPLDGSELADRVIVQVRRLLHARDAEVILLGVVEEDAVGRTYAPGHNALTVARKHLEKVRDDLVAQGARAHVRLEVGDPASKIIERARDDDVSLVAMSTHGRSGVSRLVRGSVAERVMRGSGAPVLVANPQSLEPNRDARFGRILVPVDGSERAAEVLPLVQELARIYGSTIILVNVLEIVVTPDPVILVSPTRTRDEGEALLAEYRKRIDPAIPVETRIALGTPAVAILDAVSETKADLVAMASHGRTGVSRWVYGSVAESVVRQCACPLLVVRTAGYHEGAVAPEAEATAQSR